MIIFFTGLAAGMVHVLTGPDHLAAIAPLSLNSRKSNWLIGFKWGIGHTGGVFVVALLALLFRELIPINLLSSYSERFVGIILIGIGLWGLKKVLFKNIHMHEHVHDGQRHIHIHTHQSLEEHNKIEAHNHSHAAFGIGIIHGFAGSSHLLGILPALALPTRLGAITYLGAFGIGTITAMVIFSIIMGSLAVKFSFFGIKAYQGLLTTFSIAAIVIGGFWLSF
jgi:ABC-type nickel/cobalt efflux system permease component RcnA